MPRRRYELEVPTFAQVIKILETMPAPERRDLEAIKLRHLALGFTYQNFQIHRAIRALNTRFRAWDHRTRASRRSRSSRT